LPGKGDSVKGTVKQQKLVNITLWRNHTDYALHEALL
jgi:hypothetical protein